MTFEPTGINDEDDETTEQRAPVELAKRPLCDRISYIADQLETSIAGLRGLIGVSRTRVVLAASVATLREVADGVLEQEVELTEMREQRDGDVRAVAALTAERDEARELARVSLDILRNVSDEPMRELYGVDDFGELPEWFTGYGKPGGKR